jgi:hypothetical protein
MGEEGVLERGAGRLVVATCLGLAAAVLASGGVWLLACAAGTERAP